MNTEHLLKAVESAGFLAEDVRFAHRAAVNAENQLAEYVLLDLINETAMLKHKIKTIHSAIAQTK